MKLVVLAYLEEDEKCVARLLAELEVAAFSRLAVEGHGPAAAGGWYGSTAPYRSELTLIFIDDAGAGRILDAVRTCTGVVDPRHPIRAFLVDVQDATSCGCARDEADDGANFETSEEDNRA